MLRKLFGSLALMLGLFLAYVAARPGHFHYERSGFIAAPPEKVYPYLTSFKRGAEWSPFEQDDPAMKKEYSGSEEGVGARMVFTGSGPNGAGELEILKAETNSLVEIMLRMREPIAGDNLIQYRLRPEGEGTRFTWSMSGEGGFASKLMAVVMDCDKMMGEQFERGIAGLKRVAEAP